MKFSFFIARRYLFAKKSRNVINLISGISVFVVAVVAAAMITVLSAVNGIDTLVRQLFSHFDAPVRVIPARGKVFSTDTLDLTVFTEHPGIKAVSKVLEDDVIAGFEDRKVVATLRGVDRNITEIASMDSIVISGSFILEEGGYPYAVMGWGVKNELQLPFLNDERAPVQLYAPIRGKKLSTYRENAFNRDQLLVSGIYSINAELDVKYILVPLSFAGNLFDRDTSEVSALEIGLNPGATAGEIDAYLESRLGTNWKVETREEKNALIFKTNQTEKWATYLILLFILLIAAFNIMASLTMLIIEKKRDIFILRSMGVPELGIQRIFMLEGIMINLIGAIFGLAAGLALCYAQQKFGLVPLQGSIVPFYPVEVRFSDVAIIFTSIMIIGSGSSSLLVRYLIHRHARA